MLYELNPRGGLIKAFTTGLGVVGSLTGLVSPVAAQSTEIGVAAYAFGLGDVHLGAGRLSETQNRTLTYLRYINPDRLLYNFRLNHGLSTINAQPLAGWEAPDFPFRTHGPGHFLTAWAQCWAVLADEECRSRATYFAAELAKCQANNNAKGFNAGYLSGFPESEIDKVEDRTLSNGNVPYYALHKTLAGLLDVWKYTGDATAKKVLLDFTAWVDWRTSRLTYTQMQNMMATEFGGMNEVLADVYHQTGDSRWLTVAQRFDHASVFDPLASNLDRLNGLHANTQVPKWIGAAREYKATGTQRYLDIAKNAWDFTVHEHSYAIGGNSQSEHFRAPNAIAGFLNQDTCESCNTYNMLKLTRELWLVDPNDSSYFDFFERAFLNHYLGIQDPQSSHGHITYFTPLNPGGSRGVGPAWGGGTWSTDHDSFWCCQVTALESFTKLADSVYFHSADDSTLWVNQFTPTTLTWAKRNTVVTQDTSFPEGDTSTFTIQSSASAQWTFAVRIPGWTSGATITVNGTPVNVAVTPGSYAKITRTWANGDKIVVRVPFKLYTIAANDDSTLAAVAYGPLVLAGNYGSETVSSTPTLNLSTVKRTNSTSIQFQATVNGSSRTLIPFLNAHQIKYVVYFKIQ